MWVYNLTKAQFDLIAMTMRNNRRGYEYYTDDYSAIKLTMKDWYEFFPDYIN